MTDGLPGDDRVVVAACRSELQADVLIAQLAQRGIDARKLEVGAPDLLGGRAVRVSVPRGDLDLARTVAETLTGKDRVAGLLDARRLVPAVLFLVGLVTLIAAAVRLLT